MAIRAEVAALADKYRCDPHDPVFGVLEAVFELRDDLVARTSPIDAGTIKADLERIGEGIDTRTARLKHTLDEFGAETTRAEELVKQSAQALFASRQIRAREKLMSGLIGMCAAAVPLMGIFGWAYSHSTDLQLARAGVRLVVEATPEGYRVALQGKRVLRSGQSDQRVLVEFSK